MTEDYSGAWEQIYGGGGSSQAATYVPTAQPSIYDAVFNPSNPVYQSNPPAQTTYVPQPTFVPQPTQQFVPVAPVAAPVVAAAPFRNQFGAALSGDGYRLPQPASAAAATAPESASARKTIAYADIGRPGAAESAATAYQLEPGRVVPPLPGISSPPVIDVAGTPTPLAKTYAEAMSIVDAAIPVYSNNATDDPYGIAGDAISKIKTANETARNNLFEGVMNGVLPEGFSLPRSMDVNSFNSAVDKISAVRESETAELLAGTLPALESKAEAEWRASGEVKKDGAVYEFLSARAKSPAELGPDAAEADVKKYVEIAYPKYAAASYDKLIAANNAVAADAGKSDAARQVAIDRVAALTKSKSDLLSPPAAVEKSKGGEEPAAEPASIWKFSDDPTVAALQKAETNDPLVVEAAKRVHELDAQILELEKSNDGKPTQADQRRLDGFRKERAELASSPVGTIGLASARVAAIGKIAPLVKANPSVAAGAINADGSVNSVVLRSNVAGQLLRNEATARFGADAAKAMESLPAWRTASRSVETAFAGTGSGLDQDAATVGAKEAVDGVLSVAYANRVLSGHPGIVIGPDGTVKGATVDTAGELNNSVGAARALYGAGLVDQANAVAASLERSGVHVDFNNSEKPFTAVSGGKLQRLGGVQALSARDLAQDEFARIAEESGVNSEARHPSSRVALSGLAKTGANNLSDELADLNSRYLGEDSVMTDSEYKAEKARLVSNAEEKFKIAVLQENMRVVSDNGWTTVYADGTEKANLTGRLQYGTFVLSVLAPLASFATNRYETRRAEKRADKRWEDEKEWWKERAEIEQGYRMEALNAQLESAEATSGKGRPSGVQVAAF